LRELATASAGLAVDRVAPRSGSGEDSNGGDDVFVRLRHWNGEVTGIRNIYKRAGDQPVEKTTLKSTSEELPI
jgi:hypothetical protein